MEIQLTSVTSVETLMDFIYNATGIPCNEEDVRQSYEWYSMDNIFGLQDTSIVCFTGTRYSDSTSGTLYDEMIIIVPTYGGSLLRKEDLIIEPVEHTYDQETFYSFNIYNKSDLDVDIYSTYAENNEWRYITISNSISSHDRCDMNDYGDWWHSYNDDIYDSATPINALSLNHFLTDLGTVIKKCYGTAPISDNVSLIGLLHNHIPIGYNNQRLLMDGDEDVRINPYMPYVYTSIFYSMFGEANSATYTNKGQYHCVFIYAHIHDDGDEYYSDSNDKLFVISSSSHDVRLEDIDVWYEGWNYWWYSYGNLLIRNKTNFDVTISSFKAQSYINGETELAYHLGVFESDDTITAGSIYDEDIELLDKTIIAFDSSQPLSAQNYARRIRRLNGVSTPASTNIASKDSNLGDYLTDIANAIRDKKGTTGSINAQDFISEVLSIVGGN